MERTADFRKSILASDVIIYDLLTNNYEEVDYVIKTLKTADLGDSHKTLILLSSVMTWVNTPPKYKQEGAEGGEGEGEAEEEPEGEPEGAEGEAPEVDANGEPIVKKKPIFFKESDYHLRVPDENYQQIKTLETLAMSSVKTQPKLTVHVLCSGIRYGLGEGRLYELFKAAWLQNPRALSYSGKGENMIPTIHILDLARLVRRMVQASSLKTAQDKAIHAKQYIFAIDRTAKPTQKNLITSISRGIGTGHVDSRGESAYSHYPRD
jgi:adenylate kinase